MRLMDDLKQYADPRWMTRSVERRRGPCIQYWIQYVSESHLKWCSFQSGLNGRALAPADLPPPHCYVNNFNESGARLEVA